MAPFCVNPVADRRKMLQGAVLLKKSERLNQELIFLQSKSTFNVNDLMTEFSISRRTALRDVKELEEIGVPIYVEAGRNGKYHILEHTLFVPVNFSENEIASILFAIQALEKLIQTPFDKSYTQIYQKLLSTLPQNKKASIEDYLSNIEYKSVPAVASSDHLREVLSAAQSNQIIEMEYTQYGPEKILVYIYNLFFQDGVWFFNGYECETRSWRVYRCDCIRSCHKVSSTVIFPDKKTARKSLMEYKEQHETLQFKCSLTPFGKELFLKSNYYDMTIQESGDGEIILTGKIDRKNMKYLVNYFISFGNDLHVVSPGELVDAYKSTLETILLKY